MDKDRDSLIEWLQNCKGETIANPETYAIMNEMFWNKVKIEGLSEDDDKDMEREIRVRK